MNNVDNSIDDIPITDADDVDIDDRLYTLVNDHGFCNYKEKLIMHDRIYSIFDSVASVFQRPILFRSEPEALRYFRLFCDENKSIMSDFVLYNIGLFDAETGNLTEVTPFVVAHGKDFVNVQN